jgi:hypothetical protein
LKVVSESRDTHPEENWWHDVVSLKETKLGELHEIFNELPTGLNELRAQYPADVRPPHAVDARWMNIFLSV